MNLLKALGFQRQTEIPTEYTESAAPLSTDLDRRREMAQRNEDRLVRYLKHPEAKRRYRQWLAIRKRLGLG